MKNGFSPGSVKQLTILQAVSLDGVKEEIRFPAIPGTVYMSAWLIVMIIHEQADGHFFK